MRVGKLSGGQRRRLDVAIGICGDPDLLFLDEPTTGFDPGARRQAWAAIRGLRDEGKTILLTTHFMDEAQALADRAGDHARGPGRGARARSTRSSRAARTETRIRFEVRGSATPPTDIVPVDAQDR